jgi:pimeloyl-ACP methyl ester carboxylesterase
MFRRVILNGASIFWILWLLLLTASLSAQQLSASPAPTPLGRLVSVDGHQMHINCTGKGSPTVILEAGTGAFSFDWSLVQPEVAKFTRVCSYDRAGMAWSEMGPQPRTIRQKAYELHALLTNAKVPGPYVLVGHSGGGYIIRLFQAKYPNEVVGMVLAECGHENSLFLINGKLVRMRELSKGRPIPEPRSEIKESERTIAPDVLQEIEKQSKLFGPPTIDPPYDKLPPNIQQIRLWALAQPAHLLADNNPLEGEEMVALDRERRSRPYPLGSLPLIVLHREVGGYKPIPKMINLEQVKQLEEERVSLNRELVSLSRNSAHIIAKNSTHDIHLDRPELVVDAIRQVLDAARHHKSVKHDEVVE